MIGNRDYPPRMRLSKVVVLIFFIPTIIAGIILFIDFNRYSSNMEEVEVLQERIEQIEKNMDLNINHHVAHYFKLPNGNSIAITKELEGLIINEWDATSLEIIQSSPIESIIFNNIVSTYQNDGIVMLTANPNEESRHYYYESGKEVEKLDIPTIVDVPITDQASLVYNQMLYTVGQNENEEFIVLIVKDDDVEVVNLSEIPELVLAIDAGFEQPSLSVSGVIYPILNLRTYDQEAYYIVLAPNRSGDYPIVKDLSSIHQKDDILYEEFFDASTPYIHIYKNEPHLSSLDYSVDRVKMELPEKIFYPKLFYLSDNNVAIIGKSSFSENGSILGYIYDSTGTELRFDLTPFIQENSALFTDYEQSSFQIQLHNDILYTMSEEQANALDLALGTSMPTANGDVFSEVLFQSTKQLTEEADEVLEAGKVNTEEKFNDYINNSSSAKTIGTVWLLATLIVSIILFIPFMVTRSYVKNIQRAYDNGGGRVQAVVQEVIPTNLYVNDIPHADLIVRFTYRFQKHERKLRLRTNIKEVLEVGDTIEVVYDPVLDELYEIKYTQDDVY